MGELITNLGINGKLFIAQVINFLILLAVLYFFAYKPILGLLQKRTKKIEDSIKNAEKVEKQLEQANVTFDRRVTEARTEAQKIIEQASEEAEKNRAETINKTKTKVEQLVEQAKVQINQEKSKMMREARGELAELVIAASSKVLERNLTDKDNEKLFTETIKASDNKSKVYEDQSPTIR